ncbi:GMC oxidoreductase [Sphaerobolus stellatus SS14]|uniref:GMC oxidoreductase n=1 Tax=Sphaerobolus stellatus (strain SS14) TaxID=990650 RepID=A0A0C9VLW0_SPHS4|nr:GMC oxidoreductase [Sphaerobolus stellatus SS14]
MDAPAWLSTVEEFVRETFDYIIGNSLKFFLCSLSENPRWKIGVIEAELYRADDPKIDVPASWSYILADSSYTWRVFSTPRKHPDERLIYLPSPTEPVSKTTTIGKHCVMRDGIGSLLPCFKKSETYTSDRKIVIFPKVTPLEEKAAAQMEEDYRGLNGPVQDSFSTPNTEIDNKFVETFNKLGIASHLVPADLATGVFNIPKVIHPETKKRSSSVNRCLGEVINRENIMVLTEAYATRLLFDEDKSLGLRILSVEFFHRGNTYRVKANREIILAAAEIVILGIQPVARTDSVTLFLATQHPYSCGSHVQCKDPLEKLNIDPNFLGNAFDLRVIRALLKFSRTFVTTALVKDYFLEYTQPAGIEDFTEDEQFDKYIRSSVRPVFHPSGTAAMAPRELRGVADTSLRVYGTQALRIVDASVFP